MSIYKLFTGTSSGCAFLLLLMFQRVDRCLLYSTKAELLREPYNSCPRQSEKGFFSWYIRALGQGSALRTG